MRKMLLRALAIILLLFTAGCASEKTSREDVLPDAPLESVFEEALSVDEQFINALASGLTARWEADRSQTFDNNTTGVEEIANRKNCIEAELAAIGPFDTQEFENLELGKLASRYINLLYTSADVLEYREKGDYAYFDIWDDIYYERCSLLAVFVDQYGLTIDETHQAILNEMIVNGENATEKLNELHKKSASVCYSRMIQSIEAIREGFGSGRVGTQEFQDAVYYIVPEHIYIDASSGDERMVLIHDYIDRQEYFADYFTVGEYGDMSIEFKNIVAFVEDCQAVGLFTGEDVSGFNLADSITSIQSFSDAFDITDNVAIAMLYAVDTADCNWDESIVCEVLSKQSDMHFLP